MTKFRLRIPVTSERECSPGSPWISWKLTWVGCLWLLLLASGLGSNALGSNNPGSKWPEGLSRCKYSVRDVAFVNVHGRSWQLELIKPADVEAGVFEGWNQVLKSELQSSNLGYLWHQEGSARANQLSSLAGRPVNSSKASSTLPAFYVTNRNGQVLPVEPQENADFEPTIRGIVDSPVRNRLLDKLAVHLCVYLLILGEDQAKNQAAYAKLRAAVDQVDKQMWMMEKASDKGPAIEKVQASDASERMALKSIGFSIEKVSDEPVVAVMFGQARRLGDLIPAAQLETKKLVSLAAICGSDCECELDRDWLYGEQMLHRWTREHERMAEDELDFDPKSAFVMAEVSQILQKTAGSAGRDRVVEMGAGLVIQDLEANLEGDGIEPEFEDKSARGEAHNSVGSVGAPRSVDTSAEDTLPENDKSMRETRLNSKTNESWMGDVPWLLFGSLGGAILLLIALRLTVFSSS